MSRISNNRRMRRVRRRSPSGGVHCLPGRKVKRTSESVREEILQSNWKEELRERLEAIDADFFE